MTHHLFEAAGRRPSQTLLDLELRSSCHKSLTSLVACVFHEVLLEALCEVNRFLFPLLCVCVSVAGIKNCRINTLKLCRNLKVEDRNSLGRSSQDRSTEDSVDDAACVLDGDTLACSVPSGVRDKPLRRSSPSSSRVPLHIL